MRQRRRTTGIVGKAYALSVNTLVVNPPITATHTIITELLAMHPDCVVVQPMIKTSNDGYTLGRPALLVDLPPHARGNVHRKAGTKNRFIIKRQQRRIHEEETEAEAPEPDTLSQDSQRAVHSISESSQNRERNAAVCIQRAFRAFLQRDDHSSTFSVVESSVSLTSYMSSDERLGSTELQRQLDTLLATHLPADIIEDIVNGEVEMVNSVSGSDNVVPGRCNICKRMRLVSYGIVRRGWEVQTGRECSSKVSAALHAVKCMVYVHRACEKAQRAQDYFAEVATAIHNRYTSVN